MCVFSEKRSTHKKKIENSGLRRVSCVPDNSVPRGPRFPAVVDPILSA